MSKHSKAGRQIKGRLSREAKLHWTKVKKQSKAENRTMLEILQEEN